MNTKTDGIEYNSDDDISDVPETVCVGIPEEHHQEIGRSTNAMKEVLDAAEVSKVIDTDVQTDIDSSFAAER